MSRVDIAGRLTEIRSDMETEFKMTREQWLERLLSNADNCRAANDHGAERQALREIGLAMPGYYPAGRQEIAVQAVASLPPLERLLECPATVEALGRVMGKTEEGRAVLQRMLERA